MRIIKIKGKKAVVKSEDHTHTVDLSLLKKIKIGDYIICHQDMALHKIAENEALKILKLIKRTHR